MNARRLQQKIEAGRDAYRMGDKTAIRVIEQAKAHLLATSPDDRAKLLSASVPLALFPVRLETAYRTNGSQVEGLRIRVYPDTIHLTGFDPALTSEEVDLGTTIRDGIADEPDREGELMSWMASLVGAGRASWIVTQLESGAFTKTDAHDSRNLAALMPDAWQVELHWPGGHERVMFPHPVREQLALGLGDVDGELARPGALETLWNGLGGRTDTTPISWMFDFDEAVKAGMALDIDAATAPSTLQSHFRSGLAEFDSITVTGVAWSRDGASGSSALEVVLQGHAVERDARILPQGNPTNNDGETRTPGRPAPTADRKPKTNQKRLAQALGVSSDALSLTSDAPMDEHALPGWVSDLLWPATLGGALAAELGLTREEIEPLRKFYSNELRARGTLSALQIGQEVYGTLPVRVGATAPTDVLQQRAGSLLKILSNSTASVQLGSIPDGDATAWLKAFGQEAHPGRITIQPYVRHGDLSDAAHASVSPPALSARKRNVLDTALGPERARDIVEDRIEAFVRYPVNNTVTEVSPPIPLSRADYTHRQRKGADISVENLLEAADGHLPLSRLLDMPSRQHSSFSALAYPVHPIREMPRILGLEGREKGRAPTLKDTEQPGDPFFVTLVRHALFTHFTDLATAMVRVNSETPRPVWAAPPYSRPYPLFDQIDDLHGSNGLPPLSIPMEPELIAAYRREIDPRLIEENERLADCIKRLSAIAASGPTGQNAIELAMREHLGLVSARPDAWETAFAARHLKELRHRRKIGLYIGGYGRVFSLSPAFGMQVGEYLLAPSSGHATTAAVLRAANRRRRANGADAGSGAVDLRSHRVQAAVDILKALRAGRSLGETLGLRLETRLRVRIDNAEQRKRILDAVRSFAPSRAGRLNGQDAHASVDVADGIRLLRKAESEPLPASLNAIAEDIDTLKDEMDAVGDVMLSEAVHQIINGSPDRAGAALDAISRGEVPPETFDVISPRRPGLGLSVHVVEFGHAPDIPDDADPFDPAQVRSIAAGPLSGIMERWLGTSDAYGQWWSHVGPDGFETERRWVSFADAGLDMLEAALDSVAGSESRLTVRMRLVLPDDDESGYWVAADEDGPDGAVSLNSALPLFQSAQALAADTRSLNANGLPGIGPADLVDPDTAAPDPQLERRAAFALRAGHALRDRLETVTLSDGLDGSLVPDDPIHLRAVLAEALAFGVDVALRHPGEPINLVALLQNAKADISKRLEKSEDHDTPAERLKALFGADFTVFNTLAPATLDALRNEMNGSVAPMPDDQRPRRRQWLEDTAQVRPRLDSRVELAEIGEALRAETLDMTLTHGPDAVGDWAGFSLDTSDDAPTEWVRAWIGDPPSDSATADTVGVIVLDQWVDVVPEREQSAALAVEIPRPRARAPQAILLALSDPKASDHHADDTAFRAVDAVFENLRLRSLDPTDMQPFGGLLPAVFRNIETGRTPEARS